MIRLCKGMYVKGRVLISPAALAALAADGVEINRERGFYIPHGSPCLAVLRHRPGNPASEGLLKIVGEQFHTEWCEDWGMD